MPTSRFFNVSIWGAIEKPLPFAINLTLALAVIVSSSEKFAVRFLRPSTREND